MRIPLFAPALALIALSCASLRGGDAFPVAIRVDASRVLGPVDPVWRFFGADEPNYATMKDGQKLLAELGELDPGRVYFRAHNLLCSGDRTAAFKWGSTNTYSEDAGGRPVYDWTGLDAIFDAYRSHGVLPYAQIGFMPEALSSHPEPYRHSWRPGFSYSLITGGWAYPPKDYAKWADLVYAWVTHCVRRYGREEVQRWYWEVWNEPNGAAYWHGTPEEFYKLHDYAVDAVRRALPTARVGGPDVAGTGGKFMEGFLRHVASGTNYATGKTGTPTDFLSFHAKGSPRFADGHVRMGIANQLSTIDSAFAMIASVPQLRDKPIVIGESDPEGCAACQGPQNGYRNGTMYSSYTAAVFSRKVRLAERHRVHLDGAVTWAFEFEDQPYFAGFRALASNGLDLPVLNVFRMFSKMSGDEIAAESSAEVPLAEIVKSGVRSRPDVGARASDDHGRVAILVWHYHDDDVPGPDAAVGLTVAGLQAAAYRMTHYRIDGAHSNSFAAWKAAGSPIAPDEALYRRLEAAGRLSALPDTPSVATRSGIAEISFALPRQGVSLIVLEPAG